ncbi:MAG: hypothetical protein IPH83_13500 [Gammaproteobacteria bacterium]|nr:hypothetical protein [Gammaproteobacteria bacterium]
MKICATAPREDPREARAEACRARTIIAENHVRDAGRHRRRRAATQARPARGNGLRALVQRICDIAQARPAA